MGLPCISGLSNILTTVPSGALALVDADSGTVTIRPQEKQKLSFQRKLMTESIPNTWHGSMLWVLRLQKMM